MYPVFSLVLCSLNELEPRLIPQHVEVDRGHVSLTISRSAVVRVYAKILQNLKSQDISCSVFCKE